MAQAFTASQLDQIEELMFLSAKRAVEAYAEETGRAPLIITLAEIRKTYGSKVALDARYSPKIRWTQKSDTAAKSGMFCTTEDFKRFLFKL